MSGRVEAVVEAVREHIAGFDPHSRSELHGFFQQLPNLFRELGQAFGTAAENMTDRHVHSAVLDMLRELGSVAGGVADTAEQTYASHTQAHQLWLND